MRKRRLRGGESKFGGGASESIAEQVILCYFHALRAVTILTEFDSSKHSGIIAYFNKHYVKTGVFDSSISELIKSESRMREKSDYQDFFLVVREDVETQLANAEKILLEVEKYLTEQWND